MAIEGPNQLLSQDALGAIPSYPVSKRIKTIIAWHLRRDMPERQEKSIALERLSKIAERIFMKSHSLHMLCVLVCTP